ncbi:hypothetical protein [Streptomyces sp. DH8]|uniref:hypothetical protein n=1 Tax=Streptomyces sp. DH8 TaxID=2857008 RepID=UPI001E5FE7B0|nr:hypothetical protein [Streptomyces sp. DH8]
MTALPGQRSAQRPYRAVTSAQRVLGRAAQAAAGGFGSTGLAFIDGQTYDVDLTAPGGVRVTPRTVEPPPPGGDDQDETERQG